MAAYAARAWPLVLAALLVALPPAARAAEPTWQASDRERIDATVAAMPAQRPGVPDLYVLGVAGDGQEDVFRNEVLHLERVAAQRLGNGGRTLTLINHPDSLGDAPRALANLDNLRYALAALGRAMDPDEDLLLLFVTTHGSEDHALAAVLRPMVDEEIRPKQLREALDAAGIRHRVLAISACFSGGFVPELKSPDTLLITAAASDRPSFGCGADADLTFFGRAWLVDGLNRRPDFIAAYDDATRAIARRERAEGFAPSLPQLAVGARIGERLQAWRASIEPGPAVPFKAPPRSAP